VRLRASKYVLRSIETATIAIWNQSIQWSLKDVTQTDHWRDDQMSEKLGHAKTIPATSKLKLTCAHFRGFEARPLQLGPFPGWGQKFVGFDRVAAGFAAKHIEYSTRACNAGDQSGQPMRGEIGHAGQLRGVRHSASANFIHSKSPKLSRLIDHCRKRIPNLETPGF